MTKEINQEINQNGLYKVRLLADSCCINAIFRAEIKRAAKEINPLLCY